MSGWKLKRSDGTTKPLKVPARTQAQLDRGKRNVEHPAPPPPSTRRARPDR